MKKMIRLKLRKETVRRLLRSDALAGVHAGYTTVGNPSVTDEMGQCCSIGMTCICGPVDTMRWCISDVGSCPN